MNRFIALAKKGRGGAPRYALSLLLILFMWLGVGSMPLLLVVLGNGGMPFEWRGEAPVSGPLSGLDPILTFYVPVAFSFVALAAGLFLALRFIHGRPMRSLITPAPGINFPRMGMGFAIFLSFNLLANAVSYILEPASFVISLEPERLMLFAPLYLALTAIQTTAEEMLFRGYLLQGAGLLVKRPALAALLSSLLFMLVHFDNPEMSQGFLIAAAYYLCVGFWLCMVTLKDGSSELAIGAHAANNMFIIILNYETSALEAVPSVFKMIGTNEGDMALSLLLFILMASAAYFLLFNDSKRKSHRA